MKGMIILMNIRKSKLLSIIFVLIMAIGLFTFLPQTVSASEIRMNLSFVPTDVAYNDDLTVMYVSEKGAMNV